MDFTILSREQRYWNRSLLRRGGYVDFSEANALNPAAAVAESTEIEVLVIGNCFPRKVNQSPVLIGTCSIQTE